MKESTKYLKSILENWTEFNREHPRFYTHLDKAINYIIFLESENEALRETLKRVLFGINVEKGNNQ